MVARTEGMAVNAELGCPVSRLTWFTSGACLTDQATPPAASPSPGTVARVDRPSAVGCGEGCSQPHWTA